MPGACAISSVLLSFLLALLLANRADLSCWQVHGVAGYVVDMDWLLVIETLIVSLAWFKIQSKLDHNFPR